MESSSKGVVLGGGPSIAVVVYRTREANVPKPHMVRIRKRGHRWSWQCPHCQHWNRTTEAIMEVTDRPVVCMDCQESVLLVSPPVTSEEGVVLLPIIAEA